MLDAGVMLEKELVEVLRKIKFTISTRKETLTFARKYETKYIQLYLFNLELRI